MKKDKHNILIILILSIIVMLPLLLGPSSLGHDTVFHVANIDSLKLDIANHFLPNRISSTIGNAFGYGTHLFYPMLPHLLTAYFSKITEIFHISTLHTVVIVYGIITFLSACLIYCLSKKITKKNNLALLSSTIFLFMPYRLGDIVVRHAFNEVFTFLFIPLVLLGLLYLLEDNKRMFYLCFISGCVGLLYSHLVITLYFALLLIPFIIIYRKEFFKKEKLIMLLKATLVIIFLSLPGLITMAEHKLSGNYMIYEKNYMSNLDYMKTYSLKIWDYVKILNDYSWEIPMYINYIVLGLVFLTGYLFIKDKKKRKEEIFLWIFTLSALIISLNFFPWKLVPDFLYFIQFPWRMETMLTVSISLLAPFIFIKMKNQKKVKNLVIIVIAGVILTEIPLLVKLSNDVYEIGEIEANSGMGHSTEYLPKKAYENKLYFDYRGNDIMLIAGNAIIIDEKIENQKITFTLETSSIETIIEFPRLYYLGYKLETKDGKVLSLEESENGFIQARIEGNGTYTLAYTKTTLEKIINTLAIPAFGYFIYLIINPKIKINLKEKRKHV